MTVTIELGFLEDGVETFTDVSEFFQTYSITRGKSRELERYQTGQASVQFENNTRAFDPTFEDSPYFGQIVPRRSIRITNGTAVQFLGVVEDWNISYEPGGQSIAVCQAFDAFNSLAGINFDDVSFDEEATADRIDNVLDEIGWSANRRDIQGLGATLSAQTILENVNSLDYLNQAAQSDPGDIFIGKSGDVVYRGRNQSFSSGDLVFTDAGTAIPYQTISVIYGSELLFNRVRVSSEGVGTVVADSQDSISTYGERDYELETFLSSLAQVEDLADFLVNRYGEPEFRFDGLTVNLDDLTAQQREDVLNVDLASAVLIGFTPNNISPEIQRYAKVIGIEETVTPSEQKLTLRLQSTQGSLFILDDPVFGRLDADNLLGW